MAAVESDGSGSGSNGGFHNSSYISAVNATASVATESVISIQTSGVSLERAM